MCRAPFNWRSPIGYTIVFLIEFIGSYLTCLIGVPFHSLYTGSCYGFVFLVKDITNELPNLKMDHLDANCQNFRALLYKIVQRISDLKQLSKRIYVEESFFNTKWNFFCCQTLSLTKIIQVPLRLYH